MYTGKLITENNAIGALDGALSAVSTSMVLQSVAGFPDVSVAGDFCVLTLIRASDGAIEYVKCTDFNSPTRTYTIERAQEGTVALAFVDGDEVRDLLTRDQIEYLRTQDGSNSILKDGSVAFTGNVDMGGNVVTNGADAVNPTDLVTKQQAETLVNDAVNNSTEGTLLTSIDMTNSGANDLNNIDITWQTAWDTYDYCELVIDTAESSSSGQVGWALSSDGGSTWKSFAGVAKEAISWTNATLGVGDVFNGWARMNIKGHQKWIHCHHFSGGGNTFCGAGGSGTLGYVYNYSGSTLTSLSSAGGWDAWDTGSDGLDTYLLRFTHEVGNFTSGTLKIIGYNYP